MSTPDPVDVLIIGSGMAGAAIAKRLSEHGLRIVCLEQGPWVSPEEHPHYSDEWEFETLRSWNRNPNDRHAVADFPVTGNDINPLLYNAVGGSTVHYNAHWPRLKPVDFRKGTEHGMQGSEDWPISYEDLEPYFDQNDVEMGVAGLAGDPSNPSRSARQTRPHPFGKHSTLLTAGMDRLGWHWWPADNAIISEDYDGRVACNQCGACRNGCPRGSLAMTSVTYWPKALRNGVDLRPHCRVERITTDATGKANGAVYVNLQTGQRYHQTAGIVVLAAGGLGSPRLLMLSADSRFPDGLANSSGVVGRYAMHHAYAFVSFVFDEPVDGFAGVYGAPAVSQEFYDTDLSRGFVNGLTYQVGRGLTASTAAILMPWGAGHRESFGRFFNHEVLMNVQAEDLPSYDNRVVLDPGALDSSGLPGVRAYYTLHDNDRAIVEYGIEKARDLADAAGALEFLTPGVVTPNPAWHLLGTCRMGSDPQTSVTDADHQTWDVPNLYVCDGASFVTGGSVNPTSTIGALALRCADRILARDDVRA